MKGKYMLMIDKQIDLYIDWCKLDAGFTPATIETKRYNLLKFKQQTKITDISEFNSRKFTEWKMAMLTGEFGGIKYTPQTCNNRIKTVITFVKWCKDMGIKTSIKTPLMTTFRSPEDIRDYIYYSKNQVLEVAKNANLEHRTMILLLFDSGLRINEFRNIRVADIDFFNKRIVVLGKGRKMAYVYFTTGTGIELLNYIDERELLKSDYLWRSEKNQVMPYTKKSLRKKLKREFSKFGYDNFHPHQLRHSFATDLVNNGASLQEVQHLLRHASINTTEIYVHNLQNSLGDIYKKLKCEKFL